VAAGQQQQEDPQPISAATVATELAEASQQGVELSLGLQEQLRALGVTLDQGYAGTSSSADRAENQELGAGGAANSNSSSGASTVSAAVIQEVLVPGGMSTAL
jgi:hypothetical protein